MSGLLIRFVLRSLYDRAPLYFLFSVRFLSSALCDRGGLSYFYRVRHQNDKCFLNYLNG